MGLTRAGRAGADLGRAFGLDPVRRDLFFSEFIFNAKQFQKKSRNCLKARKILQKSQKFQENSQRLIGDMINPNKVFGAHEKDFRAF
jgi:hypothetical protein